MSVIVRTPTGAIKIYCKGAETVILPRLKYYRTDASVTLSEEESDEHQHIVTTEKHINHYARQGTEWFAGKFIQYSHMYSVGLRTLLIASAVIDQSEGDEWLRIYRKAALAMQRRKEKVRYFGMNTIKLVNLFEYILR